MIQKDATIEELIKRILSKPAFQLILSACLSSLELRVSELPSSLSSVVALQAPVLCEALHLS
jgi:hypothetical protein